jgi:hypothetical protein
LEKFGKHSENSKKNVNNKKIAKEIEIKFLKNNMYF